MKDTPILMIGWAFADTTTDSRNELMTIEDRIEINPKIMMGKPVIRGTRITVELILRKLGEGATEVELLKAYPGLKTEDIQVAKRYESR